MKFIIPIIVLCLSLPVLSKGPKFRYEELRNAEIFIAQPCYMKEYQEAKVFSDILIVEILKYAYKKKITMQRLERDINGAILERYQTFKNKPVIELLPDSIVSDKPAYLMVIYDISYLDQDDREIKWYEKIKVANVPVGASGGTFPLILPRDQLAKVNQFSKIKCTIALINLKTGETVFVEKNTDERSPVFYDSIDEVKDLSKGVVHLLLK
ncbi:MAG: hypothetical protein GF401_12315 [Chitinivibrionales bacterium]|nr:hypothetical protein [Chitinivibrionales bacterium]